MTTNEPPPTTSPTPAPATPPPPTAPSLTGAPTAAPATAPPTRLAAMVAGIGARLRAPRTNAELIALAGSVATHERGRALDLVWRAAQAAVDEPHAPSAIEPTALHAALVSLGMSPADQAQNVSDIRGVRMLRADAAQVPQLDDGVRAAVQCVVGANARFEAAEAELKAALVARGAASAMHAGSCEAVAAARQSGVAADALEAEIIDRGGGVVFEAERRARAVADAEAAAARRQNEARLTREALAARVQREQQRGMTDAQAAAEADPHTIALRAQLGLESRASRESSFVDRGTW